MNRTNPASSDPGSNRPALQSPFARSIRSVEIETEFPERVAEGRSTTRVRNGR